jgi:aminoglycoside phosphotransferase
MFDELSMICPSVNASEITHGMSGARVFHLPDRKAYLKVAKKGLFCDLRREAEILKWLSGKVPAPELIEYNDLGESEQLLMSEIKGLPASDYLASENITHREAVAFVKNAASALRKLHDLPIENCPFDQRLDVKFSRAKKNIELHLLSETDEEFAAEHGGKFPLDVFVELSASRPCDLDLAFTHGDPCMPNIIVHDGEIAAFIDLDGAGVADRYTDISIFFRSFERNCRVKTDLASAFCKAYGTDGIDPEKMRFYGMLDHLF